MEHNHGSSSSSYLQVPYTLKKIKDFIGHIQKGPEIFEDILRILPQNVYYVAEETEVQRIK